MNSANQRWSRWTFTIKAAHPRDYTEVKTKVSKFVLKGFGQATQLKISQRELNWLIDIRTEGAPAHDPQYKQYMEDAFTAFFIKGFGINTEVHLKVKIEAGSIEDGKPPVQLLMLPYQHSTAKVYT